MRVNNWPAVLDRFIRSRAGVKFEWGKNDCVLFAADAIAAMTGADPAVDIRGKYLSEDEAAALIHQLAGAGLLEATEKLAAAAGFKRLRSASFAQRGDLVLLPGGDFGESLGIVALDSRKCLAVGREGIQVHSASSAIAAWRV